MAGREFGPPPTRVSEFNATWRNWLYLVFKKIYKRTYSLDLQAINSVSPAANPMVDGVVGIGPVVLADAATNETRNLGFALPLNWVPGTNLTAKIHFTNISAQTGIKNVITKLTYLAVGAEEVASGAGTALTDTVSLATGVAANTYHLSGDLTIPASALALNDTLFLKLERDATNDTCAGDVGYQNINVNYTGFINHE